MSQVKILLLFHVFLDIHSVTSSKMVVRAAGYVIYRKISNTIEFLLLQASYPDYHWSPPKGSLSGHKLSVSDYTIIFLCISTGHVDPGENEPETALREVEEESGLRKSDLRVVPGFEKTLHVLLTVAYNPLQNTKNINFSFFVVQSKK